jgi:hypothetical protein
MLGVIFLDSGRLKVSAVHIDTIDKLRQLQLGSPFRFTRTATTISQLLSPDDLNADYMGLYSRLDSFVRTLCIDAFDELRDPPSPRNSNFKATSASGTSGSCQYWCWILNEKC